METMVIFEQLLEIPKDTANGVKDFVTKWEEYKKINNIQQKNPITGSGKKKKTDEDESKPSTPRSIDNNELNEKLVKATVQQIPQHLLQSEQQFRKSLDIHDPFIKFQHYCDKVLPPKDMREAMKQAIEEDMRKEARLAKQKAKKKAKKQNDLKGRIAKRQYNAMAEMAAAFSYTHDAPDEIFPSCLKTLNQLLRSGATFWPRRIQKRLKKKTEHYMMIHDTRDTIIQCIIEGVTFGGMSPIEVAQYVQHICVSKIQAIHRCLVRKLPYFEARRRWMIKDKEVLNKIYLLFRDSLLLTLDIKRRCMRKVVAWRTWTTRTLAMLYNFQVTYWPFYTWRKEAQAMLYIRGKIRFLIRVFFTYVKLKVFRAYARFVQQKRVYIMEARLFRLVRDKSMHRVIWQKWHRYARRRRRLRESWAQHGQKLVDNRKRQMKWYCFYSIRYFSYCQSFTRFRANHQFRSGYSDLKRYRLDINPPSLMDLSMEAEKKKKSKKKLKKDKKKKNKKKKLNTDTSALDQPLIMSIETTPWELNRPFLYHKPKQLKKNKLLPFPYACELSWGVEKLILNHLTQKTREKMILKDRREICISYMRYARLGPLALKCLKENVDRRKKRRFAVFTAAKKIMGDIFFKIRKVAIGNRERRLKLKRENDEYENSHASLTEIKRDKAFRKREHLTVEKTEHNTRSIVIMKQSMQELRDDREARKNQVDSEKDESKQAYLCNEATRGIEADKKALKFAGNFWTYATLKLVHAGEKALASMETYQQNIAKKAAFRSMRLIYIESKIYRLYNYSKLKRWLRICVRYRVIEQQMPYYHDSRTKWVAWNGWLRYMERIYTYRTKGLSTQLKRRRDLIRKLDEFLNSNYFIGKAYYYTFLNQSLNSLSAYFVRWAKYANDQILEKGLESHVRARYIIRLKRKIFCMMNTKMKTKDTFEYRNQRKTPFYECNHSADIDAIRNFIVSYQRTSLSTKIYKANQKRKWRVRQSALHGPSFKKFMSQFEVDVKKRIELEGSLLFDAFADRGKMIYEDHQHKKFIGVEENKQFMDEKYPGANLLSGLRIYTTFNRGLIGIQCQTKVGEFGPKKWQKFYGSGVEGNMDEILFLRAERLVEIRISSGFTLEKIQLVFYPYRVTEWYGKSVSNTSNIISIKASDIGDDYIMGFYGSMNTIRITSLGCITRQVKEENLFTYNWVGTTDTNGPMSVDLLLDKQMKKMSGLNIHDDNFNAFINDGNPATTKKQLKRKPATPLSLKGKKLNEYKKNQNQLPPPVPILPPGRDSPELQFTAILAMRLVDIQESLGRSLNLGKRMWNSPQLTLPIEVLPLCNYRIIRGLVIWMFEALARKVVPLPSSKAQAEKELLEGEAMKKQGQRLCIRSGELIHRASNMEKSIRRWQTTGIIGPEDRQKELDFKKRMRLMRIDAQAMRIKGKHLKTVGQLQAFQARLKLPKLDTSPTARFYYRRNMELVTTQFRLQKGFDTEHFLRLLHFGKETANMTLPDSKFKFFMQSCIKIKHQRKLQGLDADISDDDCSTLIHDTSMLSYLDDLEIDSEPDILEDYSKNNSNKNSNNQIATNVDSFNTDNENNINKNNNLTKLGSANLRRQSIQAARKGSLPLGNSSLLPSPIVSSPKSKKSIQFI